MIRVLGPSFFTAPTGAGATVGFTETWGGALHAALPSPWTVVAGTWEQDGAGKALTTALTASAGTATRNCNGADYTATLSVLVRDNTYVGLNLRTNAAATDYIAVIFHQGVGKVRYYEYAGGVASNILDGTTSWTDNTTYTLAVVLSGTSVTVKLNGGTEITTTCQGSLLSATYIALTQAVNAGSSKFGTLTVA